LRRFCVEDECLEVIGRIILIKEVNVLNFKGKKKWTWRLKLGIVQTREIKSIIKIIFRFNATWLLSFHDIVFWYFKSFRQSNFFLSWYLWYFYICCIKYSQPFFITYVKHEQKCFLHFKNFTWCIWWSLQVWSLPAWLEEVQQ